MAAWYFFLGRQRPFQIGGWIAFRAPGRDGIAHDLPDELLGSVRRFQRAAFLNALDDGQQFGGGDSRNRTRAQPREHTPFQALFDVQVMALKPARRMVRHELAGEGFKTVRGTFRLRCLGRSSLGTWIDPGREQAAGFALRAEMSVIMRFAA